MGASPTSGGREQDHPDQDAVSLSWSSSLAPLTANRAIRDRSASSIRAAWSLIRVGWSGEVGDRKTVIGTPDSGAPRDPPAHGQGPTRHRHTEGSRQSDTRAEHYRAIQSLRSCHIDVSNRPTKKRRQRSDVPKSTGIWDNAYSRIWRSVIAAPTAVRDS